MARDLYTCKKPGCGVITTDGEVDHITPLHKGGSDEDGNLQYLCKPHHYEKSQTEQGLRVTIGSDADGWPSYDT